MVAVSALARFITTSTWQWSMIPGLCLAGSRLVTRWGVGRDIHTVKPGLGQMLTSVKRVLPCSGVEIAEAILIAETFHYSIKDFTLFSLKISSCVTLSQYHVPVPSHDR
jgi:hypothetical protein